MGINIFDEKYILLFEPYDGVECIDSILQNINHYKDFTTKKAREDGLEVIEKLFGLELVEIFHWGKYHSKLEDKKLPNSKIINYIEELWFEGADFIDFSDMPMFGYKKWYVEKLENLGMTHTTNWRNFVKNKIGGLEKWIEENKPKKKLNE